MKYAAYTDGSSRGNPGRAGWACIIMNDETVREQAGRNDLATNNQMEILGVLYALNFATLNLNKNESDVVSGSDSMEIFSDSKYVVTGCNEWIYNWVRNNWKTAAKKEVINKNLWQEVWSKLTELKEKNIKLKVTHIYGHSGHMYNERADTLCTNAALKAELNFYQGKRDEYEEFVIADNKLKK